MTQKQKRAWISNGATGRKGWLAALLACGLLAACGLPAADEHELNGSLELSGTYNRVSGAGKDQSPLTPGYRYFNTLNLFGNGPLAGDFEYFYNLGLRTTNDEAMDVERLSLANLQFRMTDRKLTLAAGDIFETFSQYSLSSALKGVSFKYADPDANRPEITLVYGIAYPRWESFWKHRDYTRAIERQAWGVSVHHKLLPDLRAGLSYLRTKDHVRVNNADLYNTDIYAADWEWTPIQGLSIQGESAMSKAAVTDVTEATDTNWGYANRIEMVGVGGPSRLSLEYERVSPDFVTVLGSATPDREKVKARWRYKVRKNLTANFGWLWYRDNLNGDKAFRTQTHRPEAGFTATRVFDRQYAVVDFSYKPERSRHKDQAGAQTGHTLNHVLNLNYRDRFGKVDSDLNLGYNKYDTDDLVRKSDELTYNLTLSSRHTGDGGMIFKPSMQVGGWMSQDELVNADDRMYEYSLGLGVDVPDSNLTSSLRVGQNWLSKEAPGTDDSARVFVAADLYFTPAGIMDGKATFFLRGGFNTYRYSAVQGNYRESSVTTGVTIQF